MIYSAPGGTNAGSFFVIIFEGDTVIIDKCASNKTGWIAGMLVIIAAFSLYACGEELEGGSIGESGSGKYTHNTGQNCMGCHSATYAGTVYSSISGSPSPNAVVVITQNDGATLNITADNSGNFYTQSGSPSGGYSATVQGNTTGMATNPSTGACSTGGCHDNVTNAVVYQN
ncbi:MAG: hypothetical protein HZB29_12840 [Nitrospinae bacterium]|nr:hypothetical protein [Nitrospinota bacterium]